MAGTLWVAQGQAAASPGAAAETERLQPPRVLGSPVPPRPAEIDPAVREVVRVGLRIELDHRGQLLQVDARPRWVEPTLGGEAFVSAAIDHLRGLRFEPARLDGDPIRYAFDYEVVFDPEGVSSNVAVVTDPDAPTRPPDARANVPAVVPEPTPAQPGTDDPSPGDGQDVRTVRVQSAEEPRRAAVTGSDFDIEPGRLAEVPRDSAEKMLTLAPGFFLVNEGGQGHPAGVFLRGFDAGVGQDIEFVVEGVPINEVSNAHNHGYADTLFIIPETVQRLRVTEGPFDPRQGDFAVAGTADFDLGTVRRGIMTRASYGRFNTARGLVMWGPRDFGSGTFVAVDATRGDGFGANRAHRSARAMGGFEHRFGRGVTLQMLATGYATRFDQPGVLRQDDFGARRIEGCDGDRDAQFFCTYDRNQGGASSRFGGVARAYRHRRERSWSQNLWVTRRAMRMRANFTGYLTDVRTDGGPQRGDGVEQRYNVVTTGARGHYALRTQWRFLPQELEFGWGIRYDDGESIQRRLRTTDGVPYAVDFDNELRVFDISTYVASSVRPLERLDINLGVRLDTFTFAVVDRNRPALDRDGERETSQASEAYGVAASPRISTIVHLLRWPRNGGKRTRIEPGFGTLDWMSAYGIGSRSSDATALSDGEFAPFARVQSAETGLRTQWDGIADRFGFELRAIAFYTHVDRDLLFDERAGRNVLVGESNRFGALGVVRAKLEDWLDVQASTTWSEAYLPPPEAGPFEWTAGDRLPYVPRLVLRGDATLFHAFWIRNQPFDWSVAAGLSYVAPRPLPLDAFGTRYTVADMGARMRWRWVEAGIEVQNVFDNRYHQFERFYASNFDRPAGRPSMLPQLHFVAGPPLTAMGTLTLYFEPGARARHEERVQQRRLELEDRRR